MRDRKTQAVVIFEALERAGASGITNIELNKICFRYGARIFELRKQGHNIVTEDTGKGIFRFILKPREVPEQLQLMEMRA